MKIEMEFDKKKGNIEGKEVEYYVLRKKLINGDVLELPVKKEKAIVLIFNENMQKK